MFCTVNSTYTGLGRKRRKVLKKHPQSTYFPRDETGCVCPLSWNEHCNFTGDGKCNERGWACNPHPHQPGPILPSPLNVRQKAAVATLCTLWEHPSPTHSTVLEIEGIVCEIESLETVTVSSQTPSAFRREKSGTKSFWGREPTLYRKSDLCIPRN